MFIGKRGKIYEEFVHKFFKGELVADSVECCDLESKNYLYEVKGIRFYHKSKKDNRLRFGKYQILLDNHKELKRIAEEKGKKPKYVFALSIKGRIIFKTITWNTVDSLIKEQGNKITKKTDDRERIYLKIDCIW